MAEPCHHRTGLRPSRDHTEQRPKATSQSQEGRKEDQKAARADITILPHLHPLESAGPGLEWAAERFRQCSYELKPLEIFYLKQH